MDSCIINNNDKTIIEHLNKLGYRCIPTIFSNKVSKPIAYHADVLYLKSSQNNIIMSNCQSDNYNYILSKNYRIEYTYKLSAGYKTESYLNFINNDKYIICNSKTSLTLPHSNKKNIFVKQGYTRCSCLQVTEDSYITDDASIYKQLLKNNIDCLYIDKGEVKLDGYDYGFIGGASIKLNNELIFFCGEFLNKETRLRVDKFLYKYNINSYYIKNKNLNDIGSAIVL